MEQREKRERIKRGIKGDREREREGEEEGGRDRGTDGGVGRKAGETEVRDRDREEGKKGRGEC